MSAKPHNISLPLVCRCKSFASVCPLCRRDEAKARRQRRINLRNGRRALASRRRNQKRREERARRQLQAEQSRSFLLQRLAPAAPCRAEIAARWFGGLR